MKLHFPLKDIDKLLEELNTAKTAQPLYGEETGKGFWLVGDQGVYLMANTSDGIHHLKLGKNERRPVVYARECNPDTMEFDDWWEAKRQSFGGDDGSEFIGLDEVLKLIHQTGEYAEALVVDITPNQYALSVV